MRTELMLLLASVLASCAPAALATPVPTSSAISTRPEITASVTSSATPSPTPTQAIAVSPAPAARLALSDGPVEPATSVLLFRVPGESRLRAVSWDGSRSGLLTAAPDAGASWTQSPNGAQYVLGGTVYDRDGRSVGALPPGNPSVGPQWTTWATGGSVLCRARPEVPQTGSGMLLEVAAPGHGATRIASGFAVYSDSAGFPVLACDTTSDRAIVGVFGQGLFAGRLVVLRLSNGSVVRSADLGAGAVGSWLTATSDGLMVAESIRKSASTTTLTTVRRADDGVALATLDDFEAHGFSSDGTSLFGYAAARSRAEIRDWKSGRVIWSATGFSYAGFLPAPDGGGFAIAIGRQNDLSDADIYLVASDGASMLLPRTARAQLRY